MTWYQQVINSLIFSRSTQRPMRFLTTLSVLSLALIANGTGQTTPDPKWKPVEDAMGRPGQLQPGDVMRFAMPRKDLRVTLGGVAIKPGLALGSWTAFILTEHGAMVMGDLVLTEDEVGPVMRKLQEGGIEISAVHNHLIGESPHVVYMHISSHGDAVKMAHAIHDAVALTKTPGPDTGSTPSASEPLGIDQKAVEEAIGRSGKVNGGILQFGVPRAENITEEGMVVPPAMGIATAINFQPTGGGKAAITGDFVLLGKEVNPVMKALRANGIEVTALHNHFFWDEPRVYYMHVHGMGKAGDLARRVKPGLDLIGHVTPTPVTALSAKGTPLDTEKLSKIIGHPGEQSGAVFKITIGRDDLGMKDHGAAINARMGLNTWAAFFGMQEDAVVAGDIAMLEGEVTPVLKALRKNGLDVVAIHHHMTGEQPMVIFLHYWGRGPAEKLANAFNAALGELGKGAPSHG